MKRYAIVGLGSRSSMYTNALLTNFSNSGRLVAFCDLNQSRMDYWNAYFHKKYDVAPLPTYRPVDFERMLSEQKIDVVIVTSIDRTHDDYIIRAMKAGRDVVTEKPMTVDAARCRRILDTIKETGRSLIVTFNYRYAPRNSKIKELLQEGVIGEVKSAHFEWLLDTRHGADYFRRWHRDKRNSGGLMVHKATHHFDLMNWWLGARPEVVFGMGDLVFYGRENAEKRGVTTFYDRASGSPAACADPFALHLAENPLLKALYSEGEAEDGYIRDRSVFADGISIEDDMSVLVRYSSRATLTYHLTAYSPWEGFRVAFNGSKGRLEYDVHENSYVSGAVDDGNSPIARQASKVEINEPTQIRIRPHWGPPMEVQAAESEAGHGGGDARLLQDIFAPEEAADRLGRKAGYEDGAYSILTGIAANESFRTGLPVRVSDLVCF